MNNITKVHLQSFVSGHMHAFGLKPKLMQKSSMHVGDVMGMLLSMEPYIVSTSMDHSSLYPPTSHPDTKGVGMVIAGVTGVAWPAGVSNPRNMGLSRDDFIPAFRELTVRDPGALC